MWPVLCKSAKAPKQGHTWPRALWTPVERWGGMRCTDLTTWDWQLKTPLEELVNALNKALDQPYLAQSLVDAGGAMGRDEEQGPHNLGLPPPPQPQPSQHRVLLPLLQSVLDLALRLLLVRAQPGDVDPAPKRCPSEGATTISTCGMPLKCRAPSDWCSASCLSVPSRKMLILHPGYPSSMLPVPAWLSSA